AGLVHLPAPGGRAAGEGGLRKLNTDEQRQTWTHTDEVLEVRGSPCSSVNRPCFSPYEVRLTYRSHSARRPSSWRPRAASAGRSVGSSGSKGRSTSGCSRERSLASSTRPRRSRSPDQVRSSQPVGRPGSGDEGGAPSTR